MAIKIAFYNFKGGAGKTTLSWITSTGLTRRERKVLSIDCDPQGNLSTMLLGRKGKEPFKEGLRHILDGDNSINEVKTKTLYSGDIVCSSVRLRNADMTYFNLEGDVNGEDLLHTAVTKVDKSYDYILFDCPPQMGLLSDNVLNATDYVIVPIVSQELYFEGLERSIPYVRQFGKKNKRTKILGIVFTYLEKNTASEKYGLNYAEKVAKEYETNLFETKIRYSRAIKTYGKDPTENIFESKVLKGLISDYEAFLDEIMSVVEKEKK